MTHILADGECLVIAATASQPILDRACAGVFLVTTPGLDRTSTDAEFLVKDITLLGAVLWTAGEALRASLTAREGSRGEPSLHKAI